MMDNLRRLADKKKKYLQNWLRKAKKVGDAIPIVKKQLDVSKWESSALSDAPEEIVDSKSADLSSSLRQDLEIIQDALPLIPEMDLAVMNNSTGTTTATALDVYTITDQARQSEVESVSEWGRRHSEEYLNLQKQLEREGEVLKLLNRLNTTLGTRFEQASDEVKKCLLGTGNQTSAGIAMRNVLEQIKGEMFELGKKRGQIYV